MLGKTPYRKSKTLEINAHYKSSEIAQYDYLHVNGGNGVGVRILIHPTYLNQFAFATNGLGRTLRFPMRMKSQQFISRPLYDYDLTPKPRLRVCRP